VDAVASRADEPVQDALYFWRQEEARKRAPIHHQFTTIPQTAIAEGNGIPSAQLAAAQTKRTDQAQQQASSRDVKKSDPKADTQVAAAPKVAADRPKKPRRRLPTDSPELRQAYLQQQAWQQQQRFRQANAGMNFRSPFGPFAWSW
jgi:hypothetical protein